LLDSIDHIIIAVEDLSSSIQDYTKILGFPPTWQGFHPTQGTENAEPIAPAPIIKIFFMI